MSDEQQMSAIHASVQEWGRQLRSLRDEDKQRIDKLEDRVEEIAKTQTAMQLESKEILGLVKNTDGNITNLTSTIFHELKEIKGTIKEAKNNHATKSELDNKLAVVKAEYGPTKNIVADVVKYVVIAVLGAVVSGVIVSQM